MLRTLLIRTEGVIHVETGSIDVTEWLFVDTDNQPCFTCGRLFVESALVCILKWFWWCLKWVKGSSVAVAVPEMVLSPGRES